MRQVLTPTVLATAFALTLVPRLSLAATVVMAPLLPKSGVQTAQVNNINSLISSELDFMPEFDEVVEIGKTPSSSSCLGSSQCLRTLANQGGGDGLVTGSISGTSNSFSIDLVYYDNAAGRIVRRKTFNISSAPEAVADSMNSLVTEIVNGETRAEAAEDAVSSDDFEFDLDDGEDDLDFGDDWGEFDPEEELRRAKEAERARAEEARRQEELRRQEEARRRAEDEARREAEEARARAEAEARRKAEAEARARADEERRRKEAQQAEYERNTADVFDPSAISFGKPTEDDITLEALDSAINFKAPVYEEVEVDEDFSDFEDPDAYEDDLDLDLDGGSSDRDRNTGRNTRQPKDRGDRGSSIDRPGGSAADIPSVQITARGGYAQYYSLGFITFGGELTVPIGQSGVVAVVGAEAYSTERQIPEERWAELERTAEWNTIFPLWGGVHYKFWNMGGVKPYLGIDGIAAQYYVDPNTQKAEWAMGARGRLGVDIELVPQVALQLNVSVGAWQGRQWLIIEDGLQNQGMLPQGNAGVVFSF